MALDEYTVSDSAGSVALKGTHGYRYTKTGDDAKETDKDANGNPLTSESGTLDPYTFWVQSKKEGDKAKAHPVKIVMPLGGFESGLFRFPKIGEQVLVDNNGAN